MPVLNKKNNFIAFLLQKYKIQQELEKIEGALSGFSDSDLDDNENKFLLNDNFKEVLSKLENLKENLEDSDDRSSLEWSQALKGRHEEINNLIKDANLIINSRKAPKYKNLKEIEERNNKIIINVSVLSTTFVLTLFLLVFLPSLTFKTLNFLDSGVLYPFNKLEEAYNFNYNEGVFHVARVEREISNEMKSQYIKNIALNSNNSQKDVLKISKSSLANSLKAPRDVYDNNQIIVMGMDNSELIQKEKTNRFKLLIEKIGEKQIEISNKISEKLLDLIY